MGNITDKINKAWTLKRDNLIDAIKKGNIEKITEYSDSPYVHKKVSRFLNRDPSTVSECDEYGKTVLISAASSDSAYAPAIVRLLLQHDSDTASKCHSYGVTLLKHAVLSHSSHAPEIVSLVLQHDPSTASVCYKYENTALLYAMASDSPHALAIISLLLQYNPDIANKCREDGQTVLMLAMKFDSAHALAIVSLLLQHNPDIANKCDEDGHTVLMHAVTSDIAHAPAIVRLLLQDYPDIANKCDNHGKTVLMHAVSSDSTHAPAIVSLLLQHDPDIAIKCDENRETALIHAVTSLSPHAPAIVRVLLEYDTVDMSATDNTGTTAVIYFVDKVCRGAFEACNADDLNICLKLIDQMLDKCDYTNMLSITGYSALDYMIINNNLHKTYMKTCKRGQALFKILSKCPTSNTLPLAFSSCSLGMCKQLMDMHKGLVNSSLPDGETIVHAAIVSNSIDKCELAMRLGSNIKTLWKGLTPFELAISRKCNNQIIKLVSKHLSMAEIHASLQKCLPSTEAISNLVNSVGIPKWKNYFKTTNANDKTNKQTG